MSATPEDILERCGTAKLYALRSEPDPDGAGVLRDVEAFLATFIVYPSIEGLVAHTLWIAHTHLMEAWDSTPRLAFLSPEPESGKTRALELTELLVPNPVEAVNVTPAYLFRKMGASGGLPTILYDEIDTVFGPKAKDNEEIRGLLNAGHRRGAVAGRCVVKGKIVETEEIPAYCAVALAGLGNLPDTIMSRALLIKMRRRAPAETVQPYRRRTYSERGFALRDRLAHWADSVRAAIANAWPEMPPELTDRAADVCEPLIAIADAAGGIWPSRARSTLVTLVTATKGNRESLGLRLLTDLRDVFGEEPAIGTENVLKRLVDIDESPWGDLRGKPLDSRRLAKLLGHYEVKSKTVRVGEWRGKGYAREDLHDVWQRYLSVSP